MDSEIYELVNNTQYVIGFRHKHRFRVSTSQCILSYCVKISFVLFFLNEFVFTVGTCGLGICLLVCPMRRGHSQEHAMRKRQGEGCGQWVVES